MRVRLAGVCATDLEILKGYMGFQGVLGHEFVGVVEGPAGHPLLGRRVVGEINCGCGACDWCASGLERHCPKRTVLGILGRAGAFAEFLALPERNLHEVPAGAADEAAVFCEPLAACFEPLAQRPELARSRVLVIGDGRLGLLQAQVLRRAGAEVAVLGRHPAKLSLLEGLGIARFTAPAEAGAEGRWPAVVEVTGTAGGFGLALSLTAPRGLLVLKSTVAAREPLDLAPAVIDEIEILGSRCGPFPPALEALALGAVRTAPMIHARFPLAEGLEALRRAGERGTLKVLLAP